VTPDEIRAMEFPSTRALMGNRQRFEIQREIAAQLAEQNALLRADSEFRRALAVEQREEAKKRDALLAAAGAGMEAWREQLENPPQPVRVTRPGAPPEVAHLGCLICEPDGTHRIATNDGRLVTLEPAEAARILALMSPPAESKVKPL
jgi:hypothetical protein